MLPASRTEGGGKGKKKRHNNLEKHAGLNPAILNEKKINLLSQTEISNMLIISQAKKVLKLEGKKPEF